MNFQTRLATITGGAAKGSSKLYLDNTNGLSKGQWVRVVLSDSGEPARDHYWQWNRLRRD